jgi:type IV fimbrial biogenesis protein FimT
MLRRHCTGVTLIELLIVVSIIAILATIATPTLGSLKQAGASRSARSALAVAINQARSSAVIHRKSVVLCPSADQSSCDHDTRWQHGWLVYFDDNRDNQHDSDETVIASSQAQLRDVAMLGSAGRYRIRYQADGTSDGSNLTITVCDRRGPTEARTLVINNSGRLRSGTPTAAQAGAACAAIGT